MPTEPHQALREQVTAAMEQLARLHVALGQRIAGTPALDGWVQSNIATTAEALTAFDAAVDRFNDDAAKAVADCSLQA